VRHKIHSWYDDYKAYKEWLSEGNIEPEQDNYSDDWNETWEREINEFDDMWYEYNSGLSDYVQTLL
jgi:hypothetical protein